MHARLQADLIEKKFEAETSNRGEVLGKILADHSKARIREKLGYLLKSIIPARCRRAAKEFFLL